VIQFDPALQIQQFELAITVDGSEVISGIRRPELPQGALASGQESVLLRLDGGAAGKRLQVWVEGIAGTETVAIGQGEVLLERDTLVPLLVTLVSNEGCGDGEPVAPEQCDDGNRVEGDGCTDTCREEPGWRCTGSPSQCGPVCGDALLVAPQEGCDDGNTAGGDGCSPGCQVEAGWTCASDPLPSRCEPVCGDALLVAPQEGCDDGNTTGGDGCSPGCQVEAGWTCESDPLPSQCEPVCGDALLVEPREECDDGNTTGGDGCSPGCQVEAGWTCESDPPPSVCTPDVTSCAQDADCAADSLCDLLTGSCLAPQDVLWVDCGASACPGDGSAASPYCDLADALAAVGPGQGVRVEGGVCVGPFSLTVDGITVSGRGVAVLEAASCPAVSVDGVAAVLRDLTVRRGAGNGGGVAVTAGGELHLLDSQVSGGSCIGVRCEGSLCELRRNRVLSNESGGVRIQGSAFRLVNNIVAENGGNTTAFGGVSVDAAGASPAVFLHNTVAFNQGQGGATARGGVRCISAVTLVNSILWGQTGRAVDGSCTPRYCIVDQGGFDGVDNNLEADPLLDAQYHLGAGSPAIDQGDSSGVTPPDLDIDHDPRPQGCCVDMGADERGP
jgi:cysteine-rich repeat protein